MPSYSFKIQKADHYDGLDTKRDLHVHVYFNEGKSRKLIGRYRLPSLEPIFQDARELNENEIKYLRKWLTQPEQINKLQNCLKDTVFDLHKVATHIPDMGDVIMEGGETYINVRIPVSRRINK